MIIAEQRDREGVSDAYKAARWRAAWWIEDHLKD